MKTYPAIIASEIVAGALAPVKWELACEQVNKDLTATGFWRAIPPTSDYVALGSIGFNGTLISIAMGPPEQLASRFRAVHKRALKAASSGVTDVYTSAANDKCKIFSVDDRYWYADRATLDKRDCVIFDPEQVDEQFDK